MSKLKAIAEEVLGLIGAKTIFGFIEGSSTPSPLLETRLQEVMMSRPSFTTIELAMYLRSSYSVKDHLPTWQPLLNAALEQARQRGENHDAFYGLMPPQPDPQRNTGQPRRQE